MRDFQVEEYDCWVSGCAYCPRVLGYLKHRERCYNYGDIKSRKDKNADIVDGWNF
jgi:hypothetical protein